MSPDGDQGYPGSLDIKITYTLTLDNELKISFQAETDQATPVDLTNHAYWNLAGAGCGTILDHVLQIFSDRYVVTDKDLLPTGQIADVKGTPFDFRKPHSIGEHIKEMIEMISILLENDMAYPTKDGVYFSIGKFKNYGKLAKMTWKLQK